MMKTKEIENGGVLIVFEQHVPFIAVEGPIGVGKTSLSNKIATHFYFHLLKEIVDENPFLGKFYDNIEEWSFQTEMFFLSNRFKQLEDIEKHYLSKGKPVVSDYHIFKNMIFAIRTLKHDHLLKYDEIYNILTRDVPKPNIMIYLHASLDTLLKRIHMRGREVEKNIQASYLEQLIKDYDDYILHFEEANPHIPIIRLNGDELDFVKYQSDLDDILSIVEKHVHKGEFVS